jgi:hypothetical protein
VEQRSAAAEAAVDAGAGDHDGAAAGCCRRCTGRLARRWGRRPVGAALGASPTAKMQKRTHVLSNIYLEPSIFSPSDGPDAPDSKDS